MTYLDITSTPVKIEMAALDLAKVCEFVDDFFLCRFFVYVGYHNDPSLDGCEVVKQMLVKSV